MLCKEIMKQNVEFVSPNDTVQAAAAVMRDTNIGFLPVCDSSGHVVGVLTDRDIALRCVADDKPPSTLVSDVMTSQVIVCSPEDDIEYAEQLMAENHKARMVCVDDEEQVVGIISLSDIIDCETDEHAAWTIRRVSERDGAAYHYGF